MDSAEVFRLVFARYDLLHPRMGPTTLVNNSLPT